MNRDFLKVTLKDNEHFFSTETKKNIPVGETDSIKVTKMMPNDEFTRNFIATAENAQSVTNGILIGNFFINLLLSGSMTLLWGMLNCM